MSHQPPPNYPNMAVSSHDLLSKHFANNYTNVLWPIIWYYPNARQVDSISFEINSKNITNSNVTSTNSIIQLMHSNAYKIEYRANSNTIATLKGNTIPDYMNKASLNNFAESYQFVTSNFNTYGISTIDIDYLWQNNYGIQGLEVSTFFSEMYDFNRATYLVQQFINRRAALPGAHQFSLLANVAQNVFNANMKMVFMNTIEKNSTEILPNSNVIWFDLTAQQAVRMHQGNLPNNMTFEPLQSFLNRL